MYEYIELTRSSFVTPEGKAQFESLSEPMQAYVQMVEQVLQLREASSEVRPADERTVMLPRLRETGGKADDLLTALVERKVANAKQANEEITSIYSARGHNDRPGDHRRRARFHHRHAGHAQHHRPLNRAVSVADSLAAGDLGVQLEGQQQG